MTAHQRQIRDAMAMAHPREAAKSLEGYSVETISRADATPIILHYEWLRSVGRATIFVGLFSPTRELEGVACFGAGPGGEIMSLLGVPALCLERGACVHYAPPNAASFLINTACKLVYRITKVAVFFAYADPMAGKDGQGEYGGVYQAAGWLYLGQGLDGGKGRKLRYFVLQPGRDAADPAAWQTTRELRRKGFRGKGAFKAARAAGWQIGLRAGKHFYALHVGYPSERRRWRKILLEKQALIHGHPLPYPAPHPELKRKPKPWPSEPQRVASPQNAPDLFSLGDISN